MKHLSFPTLRQPIRTLLRLVAGRRTRLACPVCARPEPVLFEATRSPKVYICRDCRHLFWDQTPSKDELACFYRDAYCDSHDQVRIQENCRENYRGHIQELLRMVGRPAGAACLVDYGSSIPVLVQEARAAGIARPIAVDMDAMSWDFARRHGLEIMMPEDYSKLPDGSVDILRFSHVLEHTPDPGALVAEAVRKLTPGGLLYITQPNFPVLHPRRTDYVLKDSVYPTHLQFFSPLSLLKLLEPYPLRVVKLFSVARHDEVYAEVADLMDLDTSRAALAGHETTGEACRGEKANYPYYTGENSAVYAIKQAG